MPPELSYPAEQIRKYDRDRFLLNLFAPPDRRDDLLTLYAFNLELARVREQVSEPLLGQIRLQWWRDSIAGIHDGKIPAHEILQPLAGIITRYHLPKGLFDQAIDARENDLDDKPPKTFADFSRYTVEVSAPLAKLAAKILETSLNSLPAVTSASQAYAITGQLRSVSFMARQKRIYLPQDLLHKYGVLPTRLFELKPPAKLKNLIEEIATAAESKIDESKTLRYGIPPAERKRLAALLLPADLARFYLKILRRNRFNVFAPRVCLRHPLCLPFLMWRNLTL